MRNTILISLTSSVRIVAHHYWCITTSEFWQNASTVAFGINVPKALGDFLVLEAIYETNGCAVAVTDEELLEDQAELVAEKGMFICPEGAANFSRQLKNYWQMDELSQAKRWSAEYRFRLKISRYR